MKKLIALAAVLFSAMMLAQTPTAPVIEGTYFPVRNTSIKQVWDTTTNMSVPATGTNITWDYTFANGAFNNICDTFSFKFIDPSQTPYNSHFPTATHATFIRTPFRNPSDSTYGYWQVNYDGLFSQGGYCIKNEFDSTLISTPQEFFTPGLISFNDSYTDTVYTVLYANKYAGQRAKIKDRKIKSFTYSSWGTLKLPNGTYNNVACITESHSTRDSVFVDWLPHDGNYLYALTYTSTSVVYHFFRNNTFGSAYLMYLSANAANSVVNYGWYTLPVDFGSISGTVYTSTTEATPVTSGEAYLYRENSNFVRQDILAKAKLDVNGNYKFDSIPYGEYRIAVRPTPSVYPTALITYFGDTTNWIDATPIITTTLTSPGHKIHVKFHQTPSGNNHLHGQLNLNLGIQRSAYASMASNPIPGVGIVVKRNPGSSTARTIVTDPNGEFDLGSLENGGYVLFVDIPGMHMTGTYSFNVSGTSTVSGLDFTVGTDSIHPFNFAIGVKELKNSQGGFMTAYPNPYTLNSTIVLNLPQSDDIKLEVYNVLGAKIETLDSGFKQAGTHTYNFSAKKLNYSAGVYFVKLTVGNKTDVIKIIEQ
jgi:hypothetical protein